MMTNVEQYNNTVSLNNKSSVDEFEYVDQKFWFLW